MRQFNNDDAGYLAWVQESPRGLVVNSARSPASNYLKLHRAACKFINPPMYRNFTTAGYIKTCSLDRNELVGWARTAADGELDPCPFCKPDEVQGPAAPAVPNVRRGTATAETVSQLQERINEAAPLPRTGELLKRFAAAVDVLEQRLQHCSDRLADDRIDATTRKWLDGNDQPLTWAGPGINPDEWFFVSTLYGEMTVNGQRTHIRKFYPRFVTECDRDIRSITPEIVADWPLRSDWMRSRLCRMAAILQERRLAMRDYTEGLRQRERGATPDNPMPAFDTLVQDHRATGWKTLSVFIRDCVKGNCFPIDSRVQKLLREFGLTGDERTLVALALELGKNPRHVARLFYEAGGEPSF